MIAQFSFFKDLQWADLSIFIFICVDYDNANLHVYRTN